MSLYSVIKSPKSGEPKRIVHAKLPAGPEEPSAPLTNKEALLRAQDELAAVRADIAREYEAFQEKLKAERERWAHEREEERKKAREIGYRDGFEEGRRAAEAEWAEQIAEAKRLAALAEQDYKAYLARAEADILHLSVAIAGKIVDQALAEKPERWTELVANAVREARDQDPIQIIVPTRWYERTVQARNELQKIVRDARLAIYVDESLAANDCYIETPYGRIVASVDSQLKIIKQKLLESLEESGDEPQRADRPPGNN